MQIDKNKFIEIYSEEKQNFKLSILEKMHNELFMKWVFILTETTYYGEKNSYLGQVVHSDIFFRDETGETTLFLIILNDGERKHLELATETITKFFVADEKPSLLLELECEE